MYFLGKNSISLEKEPLLNNNHLQESQKLTKCRLWNSNRVGGKSR